MRYTTIIDITEQGAVYRNIHCRLLYLHMVLRAGYHDDDRDIFKGSVRSTAAQVGITVSACRNALRQLMAAKLLEKVDNGWKVTKWVLTPTITARPKNQKEQSDRQAAGKIIENYERQVQEGLERRKREEQAEEIERRKWLQEADLPAFVRQYEELEERRKKGRCGIQETIWLGKNKNKYEAAKLQIEQSSNKMRKTATK